VGGAKGKNLEGVREVKFEKRKTGRTNTKKRKELGRGEANEGKTKKGTIPYQN